VLAPGQVAEATSNAPTATTPSDGRLRGPDFTAVVTKVAWPQSIQGGGDLATPITYVAGSGHRLVAVTLSLTQATDDSGSLNHQTAVSATLGLGGTTVALPMTTIDRQIAGGSSGSAPTTGTTTFVASVPAKNKGVTLGLSEDGFAQFFDLWTLQRVPPSPVVLYWSPTASTVNGSAAGPFHVSFTNPADGYSSSDDAQVSSATLSYFCGRCRNSPAGSSRNSPPDSGMQFS
jgi:hypothetical protein